MDTVPCELSSRLFQLSGELRNHIYTYLFSSTRLGSGERSIRRIGRKTIKPALNSLSILRTCRQINYEAGSLWLSHVLFSFETPEDMLDKLAPLPLSSLSRIRHVRVGGCPMMLTPLEDGPIDDGDDVYYKLVWVLKLLPGLQLDTLTVLGTSRGVIAYDTLDGLIRHGNGWRELRFLTPNSEMLGFAREELFMVEPCCRRPQPSTWKDILLERDGVNSQASISIYRSTQSGVSRAVVNPRTRQILEQKVSSQKELDEFGLMEDKGLSAGHEYFKELLVVVKRGPRVDIAEEDGPPYRSDQDIRQWARGMTWTEIRRKCIDFIDEFSEDGSEESDKDVEYDQYTSAEEYAWFCSF